MSNRFYILLVAVLMLGLSSCRRNDYRIKVGHINVEVKIKRLEKDLFRLILRILGRIPGLKKNIGILSVIQLCNQHRGYKRSIIR